jgi:hypothetical protein
MQDNYLRPILFCAVVYRSIGMSRRRPIFLVRTAMMDVSRRKASNGRPIENEDIWVTNFIDRLAGVVRDITVGYRCAATTERRAK